MTKFVPLEFAEHKLLRVATSYGVALGDGLGMVSVVPTEIPALVHSYPLFFRQSSVSGAYELGAMLGFGGDENLFLAGGNWDAGYVPLTLRREPFAVRQSREAQDRNTLMIDLDSPRLTRESGDVLFFSDGRPSERLQAIVDTLEALVKGVQISAEYVAVLSAHDLIEPVEVQVDLGSGALPNMSGLFTIAEQRLHELSPSAVQDLHAQGFLPWVHLQANSVGQIANLILRKNRARISRAN